MTQTIAITMGDAAGIGPEIIVQAFRQAPEVTQGCFVVGDLKTILRAAHLISGGEYASLPVALIQTPDEALALGPNCLPVLQIKELKTLAPYGEISGQAGKFAGDCVVWAAQAALRGEIAALVTAPLNKEALAAGGAPYDQFAGHTELLQAQAAAFLGCPVAELPVRMMLANDELRTVLVSIHMSLRQALDAVTLEGVLETIQISHDSLSSLLGRAPRLAVAGLNPHAGEGGLFGREEIDIIEPAICRAQALGIAVSGPFAPDTVFMRARAQPGLEREFDGVIAMYHDQGLIPVKYLGVEKGVNVTLGLPLIRTSPDHGTAFDIAGTGKAKPDSLIAAIRLARQFVLSQSS